MSKKTVDDKSNIVTLYIVDILPFKDARAKIRTFDYRRSKSSLNVVETNDGPSAPHGLRRFRETDLPKVGGLFGLSVAGRTCEEAIAKLKTVALAEIATANERVRALKTGLEALEASTAELAAALRLPVTKAERDADGHCTRCGLEWAEADTHVCPSGFSNALVFGGLGR